MRPRNSPRRVQRCATVQQRPVDFLVVLMKRVNAQRHLFAANGGKAAITNGLIVVSTKETGLNPI